MKATLKDCASVPQPLFPNPVLLFKASIASVPTCKPEQFFCLLKVVCGFLVNNKNRQVCVFDPVSPFLLVKLVLLKFYTYTLSILVTLSPVFSCCLLLGLFLLCQPHPISFFSLRILVLSSILQS